MYIYIKRGPRLIIIVLSVLARDINGRISAFLPSQTIRQRLIGKYCHVRVQYECILQLHCRCLKALYQTIYLKEKSIAKFYCQFGKNFKPYVFCNNQPYKLLNWIHILMNRESNSRPIIVPFLSNEVMSLKFLCQ